MLSSLLCGVQKTSTLCARFLVTSPWKSPNEIQNYPWRKNFRINKTRCYFPRPNEVKRIKKHGWETRMSTEAGRKILMHRILKGRHVLSH